MKFLQILVLIFGLVVISNAQGAEKLFVLSGTVYDSVKAVVPATKLTAKNNDGRTFKVNSNDEGVYEIKLPFGKYTLEFNSDGFKPYIVKNFENFSQNSENFDVDFIIGHCADCNGSIYGERDVSEEKPTIVNYKKIKNKRKIINNEQFNIRNYQTGRREKRESRSNYTENR